MKAYETLDELKHQIMSASETWILNQFFDTGNDTFDNGTREDQLDFLQGLESAAFGLHFCPNAMLELRDYFEPGFAALDAPPEPQVSPFIRGQRPLAPTVPLAPPSTAAAVGRFTIPEGTFTVVNPDETYETIKFHTPGEDSNFYAKTIISHISGPDNETDFQGFAFAFVDTGVAVWRRFQDSLDQRWVRAALMVMQMGEEGRVEGREAYALRSGRCARCGHKLTVPSSIIRGVGPECASRM